MHLNNFSKIKFVHGDSGVRRYGSLAFAFCLLFATIDAVSAINYCALCPNHVACKNQTSVRFPIFIEISIDE